MSNPPQRLRDTADEIERLRWAIESAIAGLESADPHYDDPVVHGLREALEPMAEPEPDPAIHITNYTAEEMTPKPGDGDVVRLAPKPSE